MIRQHALNILNDGSPTRMDEYTGLWSHIDLTLASNNIGQYLQWTTDTDLHSSDHLPIFVTYDLGVVDPRPTDFIGWNLNKADWTAFTDHCDIRFAESDGMSNYGVITEELLRAARQHIPMKGGRGKYSCPWWTDACKEAIRLRKCALYRFRRSHSTGHLLENKAAKATARRIIRQAKKASWEKIVTDVYDTNAHATIMGYCTEIHQEGTILQTSTGFAGEW